MVTSNKKLIKNFREIMAAAINAKSLIEVEIEKVDAKYAALAEKEKADFNKQLKQLDAQIEMCSSFLYGADTSAPDKEEKAEEVKEEPVVTEEKITDTIFPENNEQEETVKEDDGDEIGIEEFPIEEEASVAEETVEWQETNTTDSSEATFDTVAPADDNDEWPAFPEEWN